MPNAKDRAELFAFYWRMLAPAGLPALVAEYNFDKCIKRKHRFDFAFIDQKVSVEVDGGQWVAKGGRHNRDSDREKLNLAASLGWRVFRFSVQMLERDPEGCVELVVKTVRAY